MSHVQGRVGCSELRACAVLGQHRSTQRYERRVAQDESALVGGIEEIVQGDPRYGHRMTRERRRTRRHRPIEVLPTARHIPRIVTPRVLCGNPRTGGYAQFFTRKSQELIAMAPQQGNLPQAASAARNRRTYC